MLNVRNHDVCCKFEVVPMQLTSLRLRLAIVLTVLLMAGAIAGAVFAQGGAEPGQAAASATPAPPLNERPGQAILNPIGIGLATLFLTFMISLFRWMFRVPPQLPWAVVKARQSVSALHHILVPLSRAEPRETTEDGASARVVELACRLGEAQKAEIVLAYIVEVPFTLSLSTPMPDEEAKGQEALRTAQFIVEQHGLPVKMQLIPHRYRWGGILYLARKEMVDAIIMGVGGGRPGVAEGMSRTVQEVLKRAECEVILDKAAGWAVALP
jgi:nucleotide-binding universal stress UspA family protein